MTGLNRKDIVRLVDWGEGRSDVDRGLALLAVADPTRPQDELADVCLGARNAAVISLRAATFGPTFEMHVACGSCGEWMEFTLTADQLALPGPEADGFVVEIGGSEHHFRLPNSKDIAAVDAAIAADGGDPLHARRNLVARLHTGGGALEVNDEVAAAVGQAIEDFDPRTVVAARLACPACGHQTRSVFEPVSYLWTELEMSARRIQEEVHVLARTYGWTEDHILAMSETRRRAYLEMIEGE